MSGPSVFYWILGSRPDASENSATSTEQDSKIRRSEIWFEDGNVILQAGHTQFRVHRGIIALHSRVFKGMFPFVLTDAHWSIFGYDLTTFQCGARCPSGAQVVQPGHYILLSSSE
jgi:hypothetical protein